MDESASALDPNSLNPAFPGRASQAPLETLTSLILRLGGLDLALLKNNSSKWIASFPRVAV